jgi:hypothetical protein
VIVKRALGTRFSSVLVAGLIAVALPFVGQFFFLLLIAGCGQLMPVIIPVLGLAVCWLVRWIWRLGLYRGRAWGLSALLVATPVILSAWAIPDAGQSEQPKPPGIRWKDRPFRPAGSQGVPGCERCAAGTLVNRGDQPVTQVVCRSGSRTTKQPLGRVITRVSGLLPAICHREARRRFSGPV